MTTKIMAAIVAALAITTGSAFAQAQTCPRTPEADRLCDLPLPWGAIGGQFSIGQPNRATVGQVLMGSPVTVGLGIALTSDPDDDADTFFPRMPTAQVEKKN